MSKNEKRYMFYIKVGKKQRDEREKRRGKAEDGGRQWGEDKGKELKHLQRH